jgi:hypothetical protein
MKKINLSIPSPCHEDWHKMTQAEKGRFCGSCQKTVIDFSNMSDRQLAEFFKKPVGNTCGRFHQDQLERAIIIPRKRIPWFKYFFQFTWPAFVFLLKSCGMKDRTTGKVQVEAIRTVDQAPPAPPAPGMVSMKYISGRPEKSKTEVEVSHIVGEIEEPRSTIIKGRTAVIHNSETIDTSENISESVMDTVFVRTDQDFGGIKGRIVCSVTAGMVMVSRADTIKKIERETVQTALKGEIKTIIYPNPVKAGSELTIVADKSFLEKVRVQLLSSSGQLISSVDQNIKNISTFRMLIPFQVKEGVYFIRIMDGTGKSLTEKLIVQ